MIQPVFRRSVFHEEPTVLKRRLLPFSLGHLYSLQMAESPYFSGGDKTIADLVLACMICQRTFEKNQEWLSGETVERDCLKWGKQCAGISIAPEADKFSAYIADGCVFPQRLVDPSKPSDRCLHPWPLLISVGIMPLVGESRAWNMPANLAISYASALAERNGDKSLRDDVIDNLVRAVKAGSSANG